jgi:hypothetical protein
MFSSKKKEHKDRESFSTSKEIFDFKTPLEQFLYWQTIVGAIGFPLSMLAVALDSISDLSTILSVALFLMLLSGFFMYRSTDNYYVADLEKNVLFYNFKFLWYKKYSKVAMFNNIDAVSVEGIKHRNQHGIWWAYRAIIVLHSGKVLPISNWLTEDFTTCKLLADKFAGITGAPIVEPKSEHSAKVIKLATGKYSFSHLPFSHFGLLNMALGILALAFLLVLAAFFSDELKEWVI